MGEIDKTYRAADIEKKWYRIWEEEGAFHAGETSDKTPFSIVIPPPNVTGILHIGHALNNTLQDILVRWRRMQGMNVLWVPGTDHAGIATQNVVEKQLAADGLDRHKVGRERFLERVWKWKNDSGGTIIRQLKRLGCSCDWARERFTLDEGLSHAVQEVFIRLYEEGLIYRDRKIINWCPRCHTALSDLEVEYHDQPGFLYHVRYPFQGQPGGVVVATTRPETIPGDLAVAVEPRDERYLHLHGGSVTLPVEPFRKVPIVADSAVDPSFGTGALKITPAHDAADFEIGRRHRLGSCQVIDKDGRMTEEAGKYSGLDRFEARTQVLADLKEGGNLIREQEYSVPLGHCYRCKSVVEPSLSPQWFVKVGPLAQPAIAAVREKKTRIIPGHWEKTYFEWMENIRDWCISRQIWWGHQIPAWYCSACNSDSAAGEGLKDGGSYDVDAAVIVAPSRPAECPHCGGKELERDPDVLDTWFSSALWPFSTLGWPEETALLKTFYPTSVLVTSFDILFFWVARMMMMGIKFQGEVPFRDVYLHALVRDAEGQKMSKSKGNVIDPLGMMDKYGTDACRFTLAAMAAQGRDIKLSEERIAGYRNFVTKLWNAARLISLHNRNGEETAEADPGTLGDRWILSRLNQVVGQVNDALEDYLFNQAASLIYQFAWHEFCDWYLEVVKPDLAAEGDAGVKTRATARFVLLRLLALIHPLMPFVTEELAERIPGSQGRLVYGPYPTSESRWEDEEAEREVALLREVVSTVRTIRGEMNIKPGVELEVLLRGADEATAKKLEELAAVVKRLGRISVLEMREGPPPKKSAAASLSFAEMHIPLEGIVDFRDEVRRLDKDLARLEKDIGRCEKKLSREEFVAKAPAEIVAKERRILSESKEKREYALTHREKILSWIEG
jgi:valyl-tRNA synthetase